MTLSRRSFLGALAGLPVLGHALQRAPLPSDTPLVATGHELVPEFTAAWDNETGCPYALSDVPALRYEPAESDIDWQYNQYNPRPFLPASCQSDQLSTTASCYPEERWLAVGHLHSGVVRSVVLNR